MSDSKQPAIKNSNPLMSLFGLALVAGAAVAIDRNRDKIAPMGARVAEGAKSLVDKAADFLLGPKGSQASRMPAE